MLFFFFNDTATTEIYTLSLHDALPICHVRAVPTNAELKMERAIEVFNGSEHPRTVAGVARSLGPPEVCVRTSESEPSVVAISVMWELSWYRYEVDLSDEAGDRKSVV